LKNIASNAVGKNGTAFFQSPVTTLLENAPTTMASHIPFGNERGFNDTSYMQGAIKDGHSSRGQFRQNLFE
jgi:hypothetical protein